MSNIRILKISTPTTNQTLKERVFSWMALMACWPTCFRLQRIDVKLFFLLFKELNPLVV